MVSGMKLFLASIEVNLKIRSSATEGEHPFRISCKLVTIAAFLSQYTNSKKNQVTVNQNQSGIYAPDSTIESLKTKNFTKSSETEFGPF